MFMEPPREPPIDVDIAIVNYKWRRGVLERARYLSNYIPSSMQILSLGTEYSRLKEVYDARDQYAARIRWPSCDRCVRDQAPSRT